MTTSELRLRAKNVIDRLSGPRLRMATGLLEEVRSGRMNRATTELLEIPGFLASFARGIRDVRSGRVKPWRKVRNDV